MPERTNRLAHWLFLLTAVAAAVSLVACVPPSASPSQQEIADLAGTLSPLRQLFEVKRAGSE